MAALVHFSPNSDKQVICGYQPVSGWAFDGDRWSGDRRDVSCGECAAAIKAQAALAQQGDGPKK